MKILVVDDNADDRKVLRYIIEAHAHAVVEAANGQEALEAAAAVRPDLIISDALMPVMDGFQFLRSIKQDRELSTIPFIFYSATYRGGQDAQLAISLGAAGFIIKPREAAELWEEVEQIVAECGQEKVITPELIEEDAEYLRRYGEVVATKLEEKVLELERALEDRKRAEETLQRLNRELRAVSICNQTLIRAEEEQALVSDICRIICEDAGYRMAWVGYAECDDAKTIRPVAWAGIDAGYISEARLSWAEDTERGRGPAGRAVRSGQIICIQDVTTDPSMVPWRENALLHGYHSVIGLPLKEEGGKVFGVLLIYSAEANAFTGDEIRLLGDLSRDLAFGIITLRVREERKAAERSIALLNFALDNVDEAAYLIDENARFRYVNEKSCSALGYSREELLSLSVSDVDPDFPGLRWQEHWQDLKARGSFIFEGRHKTRDGRVFPVEISANYFEYQGRSYNLALVRDITERKKTEAALRASEQNLALHVMQTPLGVIEWDLGFRVTKWNPAAERIFGYSSAEVLGAHASLIVAASAKNQVDKVWKDLVQRKGGLRSTNENVTKDGRVIFCEWYNTPLVNDSGDVIAVASLVQDITERKAAEEALKTSQDFIRNILDSVDEGFIVVDRQYHILSANRAFCNMVKLPENGVVGRPCYEVSYHAVRPCFEAGEDCPVRTTFETGAAHSVSHTHADASGAKQFVELKSYPVTDASGKVVSVIETLNDVTDKRKLEEQLRQSQKMEAIGTLAGGVAHDFNNMLTAIFGYGEIIKMAMKPDDPHHAALDQIMGAAKRAADLTQGLLAFSRKQVLNIKPTELNSVVRNVEKLLLRLIGEDVDLSTQLAGEDLIVMADAGQIEQVLMNLATNARDAMPEGGALTISTAVIELGADFAGTLGYGKPGEHALISVSDTGCGMDAQTREKLFEPFFTTKKPGKGTGLGLAIVYGIIKQHYGNITVYSEPGKGSTFKIYLPLIAPQTEDVHAEAEPLPRGGTETILLAEDDRAVREMITSVLTHSGYRVINAADGQEAIGRFTEHADDIDLVVLDVIMPKKDGRDVYDAITPIKPDVVVLFISGYAADILQRKGIYGDGIEFVSKPVSPREILRKIRYLLDKKMR
jgi:two-component system cell cycle sensor histidine kinase/response regulator CckA